MGNEGKTKRSTGNNALGDLSCLYCCKKLNNKKIMRALEVGCRKSLGITNKLLGISFVTRSEWENEIFLD